MSKKVADFYDEYTSHQINSGINLRHRKIQEWALKFGLGENHTVLEIGCGIGTVTYLLSQIIKSGKIIANDISPKSVEIAKTRLQGTTNITFISGDIVEIPINEKFDFIILPDVLEHIPIEQHYSLFSKLKTLIKNTGTILIHIPAPNCLAWDTENRKEILQIIDQPIHTDILTKNAYPNGLYIHYLETYPIWRADEYQIIALKPYDKNFAFPSIYKQPTLLRKIKFRFRGLFKGQSK